MERGSCNGHDNPLALVGWQWPKWDSPQLSSEKGWKRREGVVDPIVRSNVSVYHVELTDLKPDSLYLFQFEGVIHKFQMVPDGLTRPLNIAIGGDAYFSKELNSKMSRQVVASCNLDFVILTGDIAYSAQVCA